MAKKSRKSKKLINRSLHDKFWHDKHNNFVTKSKYDMFLYVWLGSFIFSLIVGSNVVVRFASYIGWISIIIWGALELFSGASFFRRLTGFLVLLLVVVTHFL
jgi:hypothetical protein